MTDLQVIAPTKCQSELKFICSEIFSNFLKIDYEIFFVNNVENFTIINKKLDKRLIFPTIFFDHVEHNWLQLKDKNFYVLTPWDVKAEFFSKNSGIRSTHICFGRPGVDKNDNVISFKFDIFGAIFYFLTCYEEGLIDKRDEHGRFLSKYSLSRDKDTICEPLVNHYLEMLHRSLIELSIVPDKPLDRKFSLTITCDVDYPAEVASNSIIYTIIKIIKMILLLRLWDSAKLIRKYIFYKLKKFQLDENIQNLFYMIKTLEDNNLQGIFYFIPIKTSSYDLPFDRESELSQIQAKIISQSNHILGHHSGYRTSKNPDIFEKSLQKFKKEFASFNDDNPAEIQNRFHYLRFDPIHDMHVLSKHDYIYDSTLGFADSVGFRSGTCWKHSMYDLLERQPTKVIQRPLVAMDVTLYSKKYMGLDEDQALNKLNDLTKTVSDFSGEMMVIVHNNQLFSNRRKEMFEKFIACQKMLFE